MLTRYLYEHNPEEAPGAEYAIIDTQHPLGDGRGLVLGDVYEQSVAVRIVALLNGDAEQRQTIEAQAQRIKEMEDWKRIIDCGVLHQPDWKVPAPIKRL